MVDSTAQAEQNPPLWQYVPHEAYALPQERMTESIKGGLSGLWQRLRNDEKAAEKPQKSEADLQSVSGSLLDRLVPVPDWPSAAEQLAAAVGPRFGAEPGAKSTLLVVGLPHSENPRILECLAEALEWQTISVPSVGQVLSQDPNWLQKFDGRETPWVLPALERCYVRHSLGLSVVRRLFELLNSGAAGRGVIGCDSWAWAYLDHAIPGRMPDALIAQAFDGDRLSRWFDRFASDGSGRRIIFRQADNGAYVLPPDVAEPGQSVPETSSFVRQLAAYSRGIPGVAGSIWRNALKREPDQPLDEEKERPVEPFSQTTIWVLPWQLTRQPSVPADIHPESAIIMHTLLIHNGVAPAVLPEILPFPESAVARAALALENAGLIEQTRGLWQVSAAGYPAVRRFLLNAGYLTDRF